MGPADEFRVRVLLSLQRALLGEEPPALRGVVVGWSPAALEVVAYFDGPIAEVDTESVGAVCADVNADVAPELRVDYRRVRCDAPDALPLPHRVAVPCQRLGLLPT